MVKSNISIIIGREFKERVAKKSFIVTTILMPVLMLAFMAAPALIMSLSSPENRTLAVIDNSGIVLPALVEHQPENLVLVPTAEPLDSAIRSDRYNGVLVIGADVAASPKASLYMHDASSVELESMLASRIEDAVRDQKLKSYNIDNLQQILDETETNVNLSTIRVDDKGEGESTSSFLSFGIGLFSTFILYMFLLMYGQMVMTSIIEEKSNRVLELVVSSVKPTQLMLGKILGVGLVAVVQVIIWAILLGAMSMIVMPMLVPDAVMSQVNALNAGTLDTASASVDVDMLQAISYFGSPVAILSIFGYLLLFLIGGFLFYASIFAAIGSAVDNIQDASQLQSFAVLPIILALVFSFTVAQEPNSTLAVWLSMIPFTSPMVMLCRIPFSIPGWEIAVSVAILYLSFVVMAWISGKIYRVGIFMYGKKPNIKDLIRWARYK
ncbi:ABC transporter permease [Muribaculaceae bacterium Isolate-013 (NCI)]|nr:ABC transporter permease [Muribaculaceae bacterium Isolate-013 (NCI)]